MAATNAAVADTKKLILPTSYVPTIYEKIRANAVIPTLINQTPKLYNNEEVIYMTQRPLTEYVGDGVNAGEGGEKHSMPFGYATKPMRKFKIQTTVRMNEEVEWADEDSNLALLDKVLDEMGASLGEGVDAGMIHAWNPFGANVMETVKDTALGYIGTEVTPGASLQATVDALPDAIIEANHNVNGIALDTMFANALRKERNNDGVRLYPDIPLNLEVSNFEGMRAVTSGNVSGRSIPGFTSTGIQAIIGDWNMAQWGIIRDIAMRRFDCGDPDNRGYDLAYRNEVAYRVELVFAFGVIYDDAFAVLKSAPASGASETPTTKSKAA